MEKSLGSQFHCREYQGSASIAQQGQPFACGLQGDSTEGWTKQSNEAGTDFAYQFGAWQHRVFILDLKLSESRRELMSATQLGSRADTMLRAVPPVMLQKHRQLAHVLGSVHRFGNPKRIQRRRTAARGWARRVEQNAEQRASP
jgi:hypothetical protein